MYKEDFVDRLTQLRLAKGCSARDMSLSIGQNAGYINNIESGKALSSMAVFFSICDYLSITPKDFFDVENNNPKKVNEISQNLKHLRDDQLDTILTLVKGLRTNK